MWVGQLLRAQIVEDVCKVAPIPAAQGSAG
jgi:hypothetical protein